MDLSRSTAYGEMIWVYPDLINDDGCETVKSKSTSEKRRKMKKIVSQLLPESQGIAYKRNKEGNGACTKKKRRRRIFQANERIHYFGRLLSPSLWWRRRVANFKLQSDHQIGALFSLTLRRFRWWVGPSNNATTHGWRWSRQWSRVGSWLRRIPFIWCIKWKWLHHWSLLLSRDHPEDRSSGLQSKAPWTWWLASGPSFIFMPLEVHPDPLLVIDDNKPRRQMSIKAFTAQDTSSLSRQSGWKIVKVAVQKRRIA